MKKQFVTYEIALALKNLGFNEKCFYYFNVELEKLFPVRVEHFNGIPKIYYHTNNDGLGITIAAPLWQQVFDWFEAKYDLEIMTKSWKEGGEIIFLYSVHKLGKSSNYRYGEFISRTKKEGRKKAILKAIELCRKEK